MTNPWTTGAKRPAGVTFIVVITWIIAFLSMVAGFLFILDSPGPFAGTRFTDSESTVYGWVELGFGVLTAVVALGLGQGRNWARLLVSALMILRIGAAAVTAFTFAGHGGFAYAIIAGGLAVIVLLLLWNARADAFFERG